MLALKQWICDACGEIIETPEDGYVVWKWLDKNTERAAVEGRFEYKILHKNYADEQGIHHGCDKDKSYTKSAALSVFLGVDGLVKLLSMIDAGPMHMPVYREQITNIRDFLEFFRRVQLPYYEEARSLWSIAYDDGFFDGVNEVWIYLPSSLKDLIKKYGPQCN